MGGTWILGSDALGAVVQDVGIDALLDELIDRALRFVGLKPIMSARWREGSVEGLVDMPKLMRDDAQALLRRCATKEAGAQAKLIEHPHAAQGDPRLFEVALDEPLSTVGERSDRCARLPSRGAGDHQNAR